MAEGLQPPLGGPGKVCWSARCAAARISGAGNSVLRDNGNCHTHTEGMSAYLFFCAAPGKPSEPQRAQPGPEEHSRAPQQSLSLQQAPGSQPQGPSALHRHLPIPGESAALSTLAPGPHMLPGGSFRQAVFWMCHLVGLPHAPSPQQPSQGRRAESSPEGIAPVAEHTSWGA